MIIPMKKITVLCLDSDKVRTLEELRDLSILHTSISTNVETADVASLAKRLAEVNRAGLALLERKGVSHAPALDAEKAVDRVNEILDAQSATEKSLENLNKEYERLRPWGNFSPAQIHELERKGIFVTLCTASPKAMPELPEGVTAEEISRNSAQVCLALISRRPIDIRNLNTVQLPERSMNEIETEIREHQAELQNQYTELENLTSSLDAIREYRAEVEDELTFARNRDGMGEDRAVAYLNGYVPVDKVEELRKAAAANGWALLITDPDPGDDQVPTCIRKPKWLNIMDPLFDFIGVTPGYRENDVNLFFLIFFPIFFGMLIGDAGYGVLFIATALICKYTVCKGKEGARLPLNLFLLLSCMSLIWGWLNGAWFGIPRHVLPSFMQGLNFLADPAHSPLACEIAEKLHQNPAGLKDKFVQWLCFLLAALQLSAARLFKTIVDLRHSWRALGNLGWALLIWGNFFTAVNLIVFSGTFPTFAYYFYGIGVVLIVGTITLEAALNLPFALIGSFVDVLSYIRLFAVGLSGTYIAENFNKMGGMVLDALPRNLFVIGLIFLILVAVFGHILNIALGFLGVLVHAIRLNTLEFSNHMEMQWAGIRYKPFSKTSKNPIKEHNKTGEKQ